MSLDLPIWRTLHTIFHTAWRHRWRAGKYAAIPIAVLVGVDAAGTAAGIDITDASLEQRTWLIISAATLIIAYAPFVVTWTHAVARGWDTALSRPVFTFRQREAWVVAAQILLGLVSAATAAVLAAGVFAVASVAYPLGERISQVAASAAAAAAVLFWISVYTRLSLIVAYAALGRYVRLRDAWVLTRGAATRLTALHLIVIVLGDGVAEIVAGLTTLVAGEDASGWTAFAAATVGTLFTVVPVVLTTTLFALVARQLIVPVSEETHGHHRP